MTLRSFVFASAAIGGLGALSASPAAAQQTTGPYISLGAGPQWLADAHTTGTAADGTAIDTTTAYKAGWAGIAAVGYGFGNGVRAEGEFGYRRSGVNNASSGGTTGHTSAYSLMLNGLYEANIGIPIMPYVGAGVGGAKVRFDSVTIPGDLLGDHATTFAYQGIAGLAYAIDERLKVDFGYRYFATTKPHLTTASETGVRSEYQDHTLLLSLRLELNDL